MSMPQYFTVVVISDRYPGGPELAATAAAMLRNSGHNSKIQPDIVGASTFSGCRLILSQAGVARGIAIAEPVSTHVLDPKKVDLWLALDERGEETARNIIKRDGPAPVGFYRNTFPDPVVQYGFTIPDPPPGENLDPWLDFLTEHLAPWREKIWGAFIDSS